ncbi:sensor histidine kinase [Gryllotalpicola ginsengisoli]|uniref:sensor histidine kinase n=1 Tax=Gryllotalpicola ginsengisoli TaxID=444608 RepID=UPI0003B52F7A|nr:histidine kinase [Gryllotalpicola ginsengisoli]
MLIQPRWWDAVIAAGLGACGVLLGMSEPFNRNPVSWCMLAGFALVYAFLARRLLTVADGTAPVASVACAVIVAALVGVSVYGYPALATLQCVAYPLVWTLPWSGTRGAIAANLAIGVAVFLGYGLSPMNGRDAAGWTGGAAVAVLSVTFSIVLGVWISNIARYGAERARLLAELTAAQDELAAMHREAGVTSERARLAREVHDTVAQSLTALVMLAERAGRELRGGDPSTPAETIATIEATARETLAETRALVATTTPVPMESGLAEALGRLAARFRRETGIEVTVDVGPDGPDGPGVPGGPDGPDGGEPRIAREQEVVLLRCAQEGLANVRKHAAAQRVELEVALVSAGDPAGTEARLTVRDDGVGVREASDDPGTGGGGFGDGGFGDRGFGLDGMRERVRMLGGRLTLANRPTGGAELVIALPVGKPPVGKLPVRQGPVGQEPAS